MLDLAQDLRVLDHRISLVIPTFASPAKQIEIKSIQAVHKLGDNVYDVTTSDGMRYNWPHHVAPSRRKKRRVYFKTSVDVRS